MARRYLTRSQRFTELRQQLQGLRLPLHRRGLAPGAATTTAEHCRLPVTGIGLGQFRHPLGSAGIERVEP